MVVKGKKLKDTSKTLDGKREVGKRTQQLNSPDSPTGQCHGGDYTT